MWLRKTFYFYVEGLSVYSYFNWKIAEVSDLDIIPTVTNLDP